MDYQKLLKLASTYQDVAQATTGAEALETAKQNPSRTEEMQRIIQLSLNVPDSKISYQALQKGIQFANEIPGADKEALYDAVINTRKPEFVTSFASRVKGLDNSKSSIYRVLALNPTYLYQFAKGVQDADTDKIYKALINTYGKDPNNRYLVWAHQVKTIGEKRKANEDALKFEEEFEEEHGQPFFPPPINIDEELKTFERPTELRPNTDEETEQENQLLEEELKIASVFHKLLSIGIINKSRV